MVVVLGFDGLEEGGEELAGITLKPGEFVFKEGKFLRCLFFNRTLAR